MDGAVAQEVIEAFEQGEDQLKIAERFGLDLWLVRYLCKKHHAERKRPEPFDPSSYQENPLVQRMLSLILFGMNALGERTDPKAIRALVTAAVEETRGGRILVREELTHGL